MRWKSFVVSLCLLLAIADAKQHPKIRRPKSTSSNRPAELRGSKKQRIQQNTKAINLGIGQIFTDEELLGMQRNNVLLKLKDTPYYLTDGGAIQFRRLRWGKKTIFCMPREGRVLVRPYVKVYIDLLTRDFFLDFRKKLKVTSGARSLEEQALMRTKGSCTYNPNAAIANDPLEESLHTRALVFDISRRVVAVVKGRSKEVSMSRQEIAWMRKRLVADKLKGVEFEFKEESENDKGVIETDPIEENVCYHIVVFPPITKPAK